MSEAVDHQARSDALVANNKIDTHEATCAERWREARDQMKGVNNRINWLIGVFVTAQSAVILMLVGKVL